MNKRDKARRERDKELCERFFTMMAMVGAREVKGEYLVEAKLEGYPHVDRWEVNPKVQFVDDRTIEAFGVGKLLVHKLYRHCEMAIFLCRDDPEKFGVINSTMFAVVARFPLLRSYYEQAKVGSFVHVGIRWSMAD